MEIEVEEESGRKERESSGGEEVSEEPQLMRMLVAG